MLDFRYRKTKRSQPRLLLQKTVELVLQRRQFALRRVLSFVGGRRRRQLDVGVAVGLDRVDGAARSRRIEDGFDLIGARFA